MSINWNLLAKRSGYGVLKCTAGVLQGTGFVTMHIAHACGMAQLKLNDIADDLLPDEKSDSVDAEGSDSDGDDGDGGGPASSAMVKHNGKIMGHYYHEELMEVKEKIEDEKTKCKAPPESYKEGSIPRPANAGSP